VTATASTQTACWITSRRAALAAELPAALALRRALVAVRRYELSTYAARPLSEVVPLMRWAY
jgi:hypothetical protein